MIKGRAREKGWGCLRVQRRRYKVCVDQRDAVVPEGLDRLAGTSCAAKLSGTSQSAAEKLESERSRVQHVHVRQISLPLKEAVTVVRSRGAFLCWLG